MIDNFENMGKSQIVYGKNSVIEAIKAKKSISKVFINSGINKKSLIELLKTLGKQKFHTLMYQFKN